MRGSGNGPNNDRGSHVAKTERREPRAEPYPQKWRMARFHSSVPDYVLDVGPSQAARIMKGISDEVNWAPMLLTNPKK